MPIKQLLENKTAKEKAKLKGIEIARLNPVGVYDDVKHGLKIEIKDVSAIESGVSLYARAWKGTNQLGFGNDGTTEREHFIIHNPPILVDDPLGSIVRQSTDIDGKNSERKLREDPIEAIKQSLAHTIKVVGKESSRILKGSVGNTTSTFYPDPHTESTSVDGIAITNYGAGSGESWATNVAAAGAAADDTDTTIKVASMLCDTVTDKWRRIFRGFFLFDTSALPDTDTISSAVLSLYGSGKDDALSNTPNVDIYTSTPASNTALVAGDYAQVGSVSQTGTAITYAGWSTSAYNDFTFNATGIGNVSKTGVSKFATRNVNYDVANVAPTWGSAGEYNLICISADTAGTSTDPKLVVVHSAAGGAANHWLLTGV